MAALHSGRDAESFLFGQFAEGDHLAAARCIDRNGFFDKDMFAGLQHGLEVQRAEERRSNQQDKLRI
jgi:hypothetical protein